MIGHFMVRASLFWAVLALIVPLNLGSAWGDDEKKLDEFLKTVSLPPVKGPKEPKIPAKRGDDGLWHHDWYVDSFLDLREDLMEAKKKGKRLMVIFEQRGCIYCKKFNVEILSQFYIGDYVRKNFDIVQLNLVGDREVTDFDGTTVTEKELAARWGVAFTPTAFFFTDEFDSLEGKTFKDLQVGLRFNPGAFGPYTTYDYFVWIRIKGYKTGINFQKFHIRRLRERGVI